MNGCGGTGLIWRKLEWMPARGRADPFHPSLTAGHCGQVGVDLGAGIGSAQT